MRAGILEDWTQTPHTDRTGEVDIIWVWKLKGLLPLLGGLAASAPSGEPMPGSCRKAEDGEGTRRQESGLRQALTLRPGRRLRLLSAVGPAIAGGEGVREGGR